jgi:cysteine sulfinate desulfinase/cysteine desulfurase-like protein
MTLGRFALGTLRLSVGRHTTAEDVDRAAGLILRVARAQLDAAKNA